MKGRILNIQKFSIHDGPGIRTTLFMKGCPLECRWCHNPESIGYERDIMIDIEKCSSCGSCARLCAYDALKMVEVPEGKVLVKDKNLCIGCGKCEVYCINEAISIVGRDMEVEDVIGELLKDRLFYEESGGGVTISGGEPLVQADFTAKILKKLKEEGIHTAVDTCGQVPFENFEKVMEYTDLFLYDLKIGDERKHLEYTGASNKRIIGNLKRLSEAGAEITARMIMVDGVNTEDEDIEKAIGILVETDISKINILPYHNISNHKYRKLGKSYNEEGMTVPSGKRMEEIKEMLEEKGYEVAIGG
ncbi:pyruvate formate lyase activating enzyme [Dethiosulfatibacter aminovorans DSM 17477]|uniref:Pyruvate formate lyase activating enzyme n=1 Tax=Dethiosulfatibacter aminovorans DSM 17477 TaxID=1121476 RepID=A0A1M6KFU6_9FIRM|nr:glycyl-radical enzyme activating protein [Dethiosulfatibacter aminovorans]SHJ57809.1 pyruvate formate lyase activating enzyme [Dethiosulfatibacter aminovorans DSM 17477]